MKLCALLIVAAVCAVLLPSDVGAGGASPSLRGQRVPQPWYKKRLAPLEIAKRQLSKRDDDSDEDSLAGFFESDFVAAILDTYGITMDEIDAIIEEDDEIEPEDRDMIKALTLLMMAGIDPLDSSEEDSSEESSMMG